MFKILKIVGVINYLFVVFLNAFTDLGHKIIIQNTVFKVYDGQIQIVLTAIVNALILLPFIMSFSPSGFLADRFPKNVIMKYAALLAVVITLLITLSYYNGWFYIAFGLTFVLALQSAIYSPAKYGYIKELFGTQNISAGNGLVQSITTIAILGGIIFYTVLFEELLADKFATKEDVLLAIAPLGWLLVLGSAIEFVLATMLPYKMHFKSKRKFELSRYIKGEYLFKNLKVVRRKQEVFDSIIVLSLFWSVSQVVLSIFGEFAKSQLHITNAVVVQGVMALAVIGIVFGSLFAGKFSKYYINLGLVTVGSFGIMLIVFLVPFMNSVTILAFLFALFGVFSGFILVPLNSRIQFVAPNVHLGTIIAGSNFIQNVFMVTFLVLTTIFAYFGMNAEILFYCMGFVALYMVYRGLSKNFNVTFWTVLELMTMVRHKYIYVGLENIPKKGPALLLGNHVSWLDWVILQLPLERQINYMMDKDIYHWKLLNPMFKKGEAIPLSPRASKDAFQEAHKRLLSGRLVGIFPEGVITYDGELGKFYKGYELIPTDYDGVIIPFFIQGVFGSIFTRFKGAKKRSWFKRREITVYYAKPISKQTSSEELREIIQSMKEKYEQ